MRATILMTTLLLSPVYAYGQASMPPQQRPESVDAFVQHVDREWPGEAHQQEVTRTSLDLLARAVEDMAQQKNVQSERFTRELKMMRDATTAYAAGKPGEVSQSRRLRKTLEAAAEVVQTLTERAGAHDALKARLNALERSAGSLEPDDPLRRQPDVLERFFHHAAEILTALDRSHR